MKYAFDYHHNVLCAEKIPLDQIAAEVGTPFYCYSHERLKQNYAAIAEPLAGMNVGIHYAIKANANLAVIQTLAACGAGAKVESAGELERALQAGMRPEKMIFDGVGKTQADITSALVARIHQINVESITELHAISQVALALERPAPVVLRLNPDVDSYLCKRYQSGHKDSKFGIDITQLAEAVMLATTLPGLDFKGLGVHIGAHEHDDKLFREIYKMLADMVRICRVQGITIQRLDLGGGFGMSDDGQTMAPFGGFAKIVKEMIGPSNYALSMTAGRRLVGDAGLLIARVIRIKKTALKNYLIIDAGMNELIRPALYGARHAVMTVDENMGTEVMPFAVSGPCGDDKDHFGDNYFLPPIKPNDLIALLQAGAYGSSMASTFNARPLVPEVMVSGSQYAIVRRRIPQAEQISWEAIPVWTSQSSAA
jgi:diaminopimelate decarboxylase